MSIPAYLPPNTISVYGYHSVNNISMVRSGYIFGTVNQMYFGAEEDLTGKSVLFKANDAIPQVRYNNTPYYLIQQEEIILIENEEES